MEEKVIEGDGVDGDCSYYCEDFHWEDLRDEIEQSDVNEYRQELSTKPGEDEGCNSNKYAWESFHKRHPKGTFFKERRYLLKEFPELLKEYADGAAKVLELGCGSSSSILPVLCANGSIVVYACDCSMVALESAQDMVLAATGVSGASRFNPFYCDFSLETFPSWLCCISCRESFQTPAKNNQEGCQFAILLGMQCILTYSSFLLEALIHFETRPIGIQELTTLMLEFLWLRDVMLGLMEKSAPKKLLARGINNVALVEWILLHCQGKML